MQGHSYDTQPLLTEILEINGITEIQSLNLWHLTSEELVATCHILVQNCDEYAKVQNRVIRVFDKHHIKRHTIQMNRS